MSLYDQNLIKRELTDSFAVIDLTSGGNVVSFVCNTKNGLRKNDLLDMAHSFEDELNKALLSYESRPILLNAKENIAFVFPSFFASSGMYILAVPNVSQRAVSFAIQSGLLGDVLIFGELSQNVIRASKRTKEEATLLKNWLDGFCTCYAPRNTNDGLSFDRYLRLCIERIAEYVGVHARIVAVDNVSENEKFDVGLFSAFVTVMLMLVRIRSRDESALISIGDDEHGLFVSIDLSLDGDDARYDREMIVFKGMVDRKRVLFEAIEKDAILSVKCSPIIEDWSLLELKVPDNDEMEFELT